MISEVVLLCLMLTGVCSLKHCETDYSDLGLLKEGQINLILVTNNTCKTCMEQVKALPEIYDRFNEMDVELNVIISHRGNADFVNNIRDGFTFDNGSMSERLEGQGGHIFIFDRCGRLTFQVIQPWILPNYPFVKAAILSTHYDNPCGGECNAPLQKTNEKTKKKDRSRFPVYPKLDRVYKSDDIISVNEDGTIPIKIVMHVPHTHVGSNKDYSFIELQMGDPNYHGHLEKEELLFPIEETSSEEDDAPTVPNDESSKPLQKQASYFAYDTFSSMAANDKGLKNKLEDIVEAENDSSEENNDASNLKISVETAETSQDEELKSHYQKLVKWVDYII